jgi:hypothetical protein
VERIVGRHSFTASVLSRLLLLNNFFEIRKILPICAPQRERHEWGDNA